MVNIVKCVPVTDEKLSEVYKDFPLVPEGLATWEITKVESGQSKAMNSITKITYKVVASDGKDGYLCESLPMNVDWRVARLGSATGTSDMVKSGEVDIDRWVGCEGAGMVEHSEYLGEIRASWKYFKRPEGIRLTSSVPAVGATTAPVPQDNFNDDIPF